MIIPLVWVSSSSAKLFKTLFTASPFVEFDRVPERRRVVLMGGISTVVKPPAKQAHPTTFIVSLSPAKITSVILHPRVIRVIYFKKNNFYLIICQLTWLHKTYLKNLKFRGIWWKKLIYSFKILFFLIHLEVCCINLTLT